MPNQLACRFNLRRAIRQPKTHCLVVDDGGTKALTLFGVLHGHIKRTAGHAHALCGDANASAFQRAQGNFVAFAFGANQVLGGDLAIFKIDLRGVAAVLAQLVFEARHLVARVVGRHQERTHAFFPRAFVGHRDHDGDVAILATGDELLDAIDHVAVALFGGRGAQRAGVRPDMGFGQAESAQHLSTCQRCQPLFLLRVAAVAHQNGIDGAIGHADGCTGAAIACGNFFQHQGQAGVIQPRATQGLGHANAVGPQLGQALVRRFGKGVVTVPLRRMRP